MQGQQQNKVNINETAKTPLYGTSLQSLGNKTEVNQIPAVNFDTSSTSSIYLFKNRGRYTSQFFNSNKKADGTEYFRFDDTQNNFCRIHNGFNDIIVTEPIGPFTNHQPICRYCESDYFKLRKAAGILNKEGCILSTDVITENTEKILNIRSGKLSITNLSHTSQCKAMLFDEIIPLADELIDIVNEFNKEVISKFDGSQADNAELLKIKSFIDQIPLENGVEPKVRGIDNDHELKMKYVKLAIFLLNFTTIDSKVDYRFVSNRLKEHISRIVALRKCIVVQITKWMRFVLGEFFDFIFRAEGVQVDEEFRRSIKVDFFSEEETRKITTMFESEISKRDSRIRFFEDENSRLKRELDSLRGNLSYLSDQESELSRVCRNFKTLEADWDKQKNQIENLTSENKRLWSQNSDYLNQINNLKHEFESLKVNFDNTLKNTINELRAQYESQIIKLTEDYKDLKNNYQSDAKQSMSEREALNNRISVMIVELNGYKEKINTQLAEINNLNVLLPRTRQELSAITQERDAYLRNIETLFVEIKNYQTNINNSNSQFSIVLKAKDDLNLQVEELKRQNVQLKSTIMQMTNEIQICNQKIEMYITSFSGNLKERDDLKQQVIILRGDYDKKNAEMQSLSNMRISLENRISQLEGEIRRNTETYNNLQNQFNQKLVVISDMEKKQREHEGLSMTNQSQIEVYISSIKKYEKILNQLNEENTLKVNQLEKTINELREKECELTMQLKERDIEISRMKITITSGKEEWTKLSESYDIMLTDIKNQIGINESLRSMVVELLNKIEMHNQNVDGIDIAIKQQIEILTRQSLAKKAIDMERNYNQDIKQASSNIENLRHKLGRVESQKFYKSAVYNVVNSSCEKKSSSTTTSSVGDTTTQKVVQSIPNRNGPTTITTGYYVNPHSTPQRNAEIKTNVQISQTVVKQVNFSGENENTIRNLDNTSFTVINGNKNVVDLTTSIPRNTHTRTVSDNNILRPKYN